MKRLIVDTSNLLFRVASAHGKYNSGGSEADQAGLAMHMALNTLKSFYRKVKPDQVAVAFEGRNNWRKEYTRSEQCVSKRGYKANRTTDASKQAFYELMAAFEHLARNHTSLVCVSAPRLEGDDVIAGYAQYYSAKGDEVIILSGDKDFIQLLDLPGVSLMNPDDGKLRGTDKKTGERIDPKYFMFEKCIRGDAGDNVMSAYPRVRSTRIEAAFKDDYARANLFNETWEFSDPTTDEKRTYRVGDLFAENELLMDLSKQPADIRELITATIEHEAVHHGKFSLFHFMQFCAKFGLKKIAEEATHFVELFSASGLNSPHREETNLIHKGKRKASTLVF